YCCVFLNLALWIATNRVAILAMTKSQSVCHLVIARRSQSVCCESNRPTLANPSSNIKEIFTMKSFKEAQHYRLPRKFFKFSHNGEAESVDCHSLTRLCNDKKGVMCHDSANAESHKDECGKKQGRNAKNPYFKILGRVMPCCFWYLPFLSL
ncbi:hypothetical protein, partial [Helicobacter rodentium]